MTVVHGFLTVIAIDATIPRRYVHVANRKLTYLSDPGSGVRGPGMPGLSQRVMRIRERATRGRPRGRLALALIAPAIVVAGLAVPAAMASAAVPGPPSGWSTVFSDDFSGASGSGIDSQWMYDTGAGSTLGTGEIETMTSSTSNVHQDGSGNLDITALGSGSSWTSGRVQTTSANVGAPAGGEVEVTPSIEQRPGAVAGERRDRHHGGRQLTVGGVRDRPLRHRPRRPVQRDQRYRQRPAGLLRMPDRLSHLHDDPQPDQHLRRVDRVLPGRHLVLHRDRGA